MRNSSSFMPANVEDVWHGVHEFGHLQHCWYSGGCARAWAWTCGACLEDVDDNATWWSFQRCDKLLARRVARDEGAVQAGVPISFIAMLGGPFLLLFQCVAFFVARGLS